MTSNLYKVGDWVYCEVSPHQSYVIRRIEELTKTPCGNVEAKVICAYRKRDLSAQVLATLAEKSMNESDSQNGDTLMEDDDKYKDLTDLQKYHLKHREVYYSKCTETIAVTTIRAKCSVLLFNDEVERYKDFLKADDLFYYHLTYDQYEKRLVADRGEIKVGLKYQAEVQPLVNHELSIEYDSALLDYEELKWIPSNELSERDIDKFLIIAKSIGTFARALDCNNAFKQPSLPLSAAAASRDITLFHAMNTLHKYQYSVGNAALSLVTKDGPSLCKDEMEDWSAAEANLFEDALDKYGKDFNEIRKDFLPWKSLKSIIEYYYTWKTTDRYVQQKRIKSSEQESKLKQVYIPNHAKQNQSAILKNQQIQILTQNEIHLKSCESCGSAQSPQWYLYQPTQMILALLAPNANPNQQLNGTSVSRLCSECWIYWKKHAAFKYPNQKAKQQSCVNQIHKCVVPGCSKEFKQKQLLIKHCQFAHGSMVRATSPKPLLRNKSSFFLHTTPLSQASRFVCACVYNVKRAARKPTRLIEYARVTKEWYKEKRDVRKILEDGHKDFRKHLERKLSKNLISQIHSRTTHSDNYDEMVQRASTNGPDYLKYFMQKPSVPCYVPEKLIYPKPTLEFIQKFHQSLVTQTRKRAHEQSSDDTSPSSKRTLLAKPLVTTRSNTKTSSKSTKPTQAHNLKNAPESIYYTVTKKIKGIRRDLKQNEIKKLARLPTRILQQHQNSYAILAKLYNKQQPNQTIATSGKQSASSENGDANGEVVVLD